MKPLKNLFLSCMVIYAFTLLSGCGHTNPLASEASELKISDIRNIVWTLAAFEEAGQKKDIAAFPPFHLIFDTTRFLGDDGCNDFQALYEARGDSIFPATISQTLRLCIVASFPVEHLAEPFRIKITQNELHIFVADNLYIYESDTAENIANSLPLGNWQLDSSTDPEFSDIRSQQFLPMLSFSEDRTFKITWSCTSGTLMGCDEISGVFGIGAGGKILFYQTAGTFSEQVGVENFMRRILSSEAYDVEVGILKALRLILSDNMNDSRFEFTAVVR